MIFIVIIINTVEPSEGSSWEHQHYSLTEICHKRYSQWKSMRGPIIKNEIKNTHREPFHSICSPVCEKSTFEGHINMTMSAAILCPVVCVIDDMKKASMCGNYYQYVTSQPLILHYWLCPYHLTEHNSSNLSVTGKEQSNMNWEARLWSIKNYFFCVTINRTTKRSLQVEVFAHLLPFRELV